MLEMVHNAYIYPLRADLSKFFAGKEAKGLSPYVTLRVSLHDSDRDPNASGLRNFFGRSHEDILLDAAACAVAPPPPPLPNPRHPSWTDEIKMFFPPFLREGLHLRFVLLSLAPPPETVFGWAWLPLGATGGGAQTLRVFFGKKVPPNYTLMEVRLVFAPAFLDGVFQGERCVGIADGGSTGALVAAAF